MGAFINAMLWAVAIIGTIVLAIRFWPREENTIGDIDDVAEEDFLPSEGYRQERFPNPDRPQPSVAFLDELHTIG